MSTENADAKDTYRALIDFLRKAPKNYMRIRINGRDQVILLSDREVCVHVTYASGGVALRRLLAQRRSDPLLQGDDASIKDVLPEVAHASTARIIGDQLLLVGRSGWAFSLAAAGNKLSYIASRLRKGSDMEEIRRELVEGKIPSLLNADMRTAAPGRSPVGQTLELGPTGRDEIQGFDPRDVHHDYQYLRSIVKMPPLCQRVMKMLIHNPLISAEAIVAAGVSKTVASLQKQPLLPL